MEDVVLGKKIDLRSEKREFDSYLRRANVLEKRPSDALRNLKPYYSDAEYVQFEPNFYMNSLKQDVTEFEKYASFDTEKLVAA